MSKSAKQVVSDFYTSDFFNNSKKLTEFLHSDMELFWNARTGYSHMSRKELIAVVEEAAKSFEGIRCDITHLLEDGANVTIRFTFFVRTIEDPNEETPIAHFMAIWNVKDGQMYRGYQMSQPAEEDKDALVSYRGVIL